MPRQGQQANSHTRIIYLDTYQELTEYPLQQTLQLPNNWPDNLLTKTC